jgi:hypothetical protein
MTKKIEYAATFSDGKILTRKSHRPYEAAYRWYGIRTDNNNAVAGAGFSRTRALAERALRADTSWNVIKVTFAEVVDAVKGGAA